jgi:phosphatidate cytidylyltransferase
MAVRVLAAIVGLAIVLPILVWGGAFGLDALVAVVMLVGADEYANMVAPTRRSGVRLMVGGYGLCILLAQSYGGPHAVTGALVAAILATLLWSLLAVPDTTEGGRRAGELVLGVAYVGFLLSFIPLVRRFEDGLGWIFLLLVITWCGDTGAYFAGRAFGKRKLMERVSPKKTIEGAVGGLVLAVVGACVVKALALERVSWGHAVALGIVLDLAGVVGDLFESMLKRTHDVKDSGNIMPGHGGILDRIDSLLFSAPVAWCYATLFALG